METLVPPQSLLPQNRLNSLYYSPLKMIAPQFHKKLQPPFTTRYIVSNTQFNSIDFVPK